MRIKFFKKISKHPDADFLFDVIDKCDELSEVFKQQESTPLIVAPPLSKCFQCSNTLTENHTCSVKIYTVSGVLLAEKVTLRCQHCNLYYNYSMWGNKREKGFVFYEQPRKYIEVKDTILYERKLLEYQCSLA